MAIREGKINSNAELNRKMEDIYSKDDKVHLTHNFEFLPQSSIMSFDEQGKPILPETRNVRCGCKNNVLLFLVQAPKSRDDYEAKKLTAIQEVVPVWSGYCTKCKSPHVRAHPSVVNNDRLFSKFAKLGHEKQRTYMHRRHNR